jgi:glycosyltransferase involved in cell wall biosynthesis
MPLASEPTLQHAIETPAPIRAEAGYLTLVGWCLKADAQVPPKVRLTSGSLILAQTKSVERFDVVAALKGSPNASSCGFVIDGHLPPGVLKVSLEANFANDEWCLLRQFIVVSTHGKLQASIEWPEGPTITESARIQGWCAHPELEIAEVWLHYGNRQILCTYGLPRSDVSGFLPSSPNADRAGFIAIKNIPSGHGPLRIRAVTSTGAVLFLPTQVTIDIARDEENPIALDLRGFFPRLFSERRQGITTPREVSNKSVRRILFVLYGDFTSNSALHVRSLANELISLGHECVVAIPRDTDTLRYHSSTAFRALTFEEILANPRVFSDNSPPDFIHAWTTREPVRQLCEQLIAQARVTLVIHLEDPENHLIETYTGRSIEELLALPEAQLTALLPRSLSHPRHSRSFLESAEAVTVIIDRLRDFVPPGKKVHTLNPAADESYFFSRPIPWDFREFLGLGGDHTVLFYHGNVHATNAAEVRELYSAVIMLNEHGTPTTLIRTGRDDHDFLGELAPKVAPHVISLGQIDHHYHLPPLMALADFFVQPGAADAFNNYRFPSKLPEFFALGRPVILPRTNLGERLRHGEDAWILESANATSITGAIKHLRTDPTMVTRLTAGAIRISENLFSWPQSAARLLSFYNTLPSHS